jgi:hypothetical protein
MAMQRAVCRDSLSAREAKLAYGMAQGMEAGCSNLDALLSDQCKTDKRNST